MASVIKFVEKDAEPDSVWFYFLRAVSGDSGKCKKCNAIIKTTSGSTSGLRTHMHSIHNLNVNKRQKPDSGNVPQTKKITDFDDISKSNTLEACIARMAAKDGISFNVIASSDDIRKGLIARGFENPPKSATSVRDIILKCHMKVKQQIKDELNKLIVGGKRVSITLDEWTSQRNRRYLNINIHTEHQLWNVGLQRVIGNLPAEKCADEITNKLNEYNISLEKHVVSMTTDGAAVMTKLGRISPSEQQLCLVHGIQLAVVKVLYKKSYTTPIRDFSDSEDSEDENTDVVFMDKDIRATIEKVRKVVRIFRRSPTKNDELLQKYVHADFGKEYKLILDTRTRWSSLFLMLERFDLLKSCIKKALIDLNMADTISEADFLLITKLKLALYPVKLTVDACCTEDATLLTADASLQFMLNELSKQNGSISASLKDELIKRITERRSTMSSVLQYLHCRAAFSKKSYDKEVFKVLNKNSIHAFILKLLQRLYPEIEDVNNLNDTLSDEDDIIIPIEDRLRAAISDKLNERSNIQECNDIDSIIKQELCLFEASNKRGKYLQMAYEFLLTIPPTSIDSERAFSVAGGVCTKIRNRLEDNTLEALTCLKCHFNK